MLHSIVIFIAFNSFSSLRLCMGCCWFAHRLSPASIKLFSVRLRSSAHIHTQCAHRHRIHKSHRAKSTKQQQQEQRKKKKSRKKQTKIETTNVCVASIEPQISLLDQNIMIIIQYNSVIFIISRINRNNLIDQRVINCYITL